MIELFLKCLKAKWVELQNNYNCGYAIHFVTIEEYLRRERWMRYKSRRLTIHDYPNARCHYDEWAKGDKAWVYLFKEKLVYRNLTPDTLEELLYIYGIILRHEMGHCLVYRYMFEQASKAEYDAYFAANVTISSSNLITDDDLLAYETQTSERMANAAVGLTIEESIDSSNRLTKYTRRLIEYG